MNEFDKTQVASGQLPVKHFPMMAPHITTCNWMQPRPVFSVELAPNHHGNLVVKTFARMAPMQVPCLGQAQINNRAFFVRYASVWSPFYAFKSDTVHVQSNGSSYIPSSVPVVDTDNLAKALTTFSTTGSSTLYDFSYTIGGTTGYHLLNRNGKHLASLLQGLGYNIFDFEDSHGAVEFSALPLLSMVRIILDWYYPSAYSNITYDYLYALTILNRDYSYSLSDTELASLFGVLCLVNYDSDYFTAAWDNPVAPNSGAFSSVTLVDNSLSVPNTLTTNVSSTGSPYLRQNQASQTTVGTQQSFSNLEALSIYMKRHQLAGARSLDRWLADFGLSIRADKLNRSIYLGSSQSPLQFGDVMSHSDTTGAALGDYAGKGVGYSEGKKFEFDSAEDFGMLIVVQTIVPQNSIVPAIKRHVQHITNFDFYDGTFDGRGTQPISSLEAYRSAGSYSSNLNNSALSQQIFGWTQRYAEYKTLLPTLSGAFARSSDNVGMDSWHLFRLLNPVNETDVVHSVNFVEGSDAAQYNRIFNNTSGDLEPFTIVDWFQFDLYAPMRPLWDDYIFHDQDTKKIDIQSNGVKVN